MEPKSNKLYNIEYKISNSNVVGIESENVELIFCATNFGPKPTKESWRLEGGASQLGLQVYTLNDARLPQISQADFMKQAKAELLKDWHGERGGNFNLQGGSECVELQRHSFNLLTAERIASDSLSVSSFWNVLPTSLKADRGELSKRLKQIEREGPLTTDIKQILSKCIEKGKNLFLLDAGVGKIDGDGIIIIGGQQLDRGKQFFYADSFDAASSMEGCGKVNIRKPICESGLETGIDEWIKANIIQPLVPAAGPAAAGGAVVPDYFIHAGCNFKKAIIFEMTVYSDISIIKKVFSDLNINKKSKLDEQKRVVDQITDFLLSQQYTEGENDNNKKDEFAEKIRRNVLKVRREQNPDFIGASQEYDKIKTEYNNVLKAAALDYITGQTKLRYLLCFPKNPSSVIVSVSCPPPEYAMSVTQAQLNGFSSIYPNDLLPFNDSSFWKEVGDIVSDEEKLLFCGLQKRNCDQNDAIAAALLGRNAIALSVDQPMIAAALARNASGGILRYEGKDVLGDLFFNDSRPADEVNIKKIIGGEAAAAPAPPAAVSAAARAAARDAARIAAREAAVQAAALTLEKESYRKRIDHLIQIIKNVQSEVGRNPTLGQLKQNAKIAMDNLLKEVDRDRLQDHVGYTADLATDAIRQIPPAGRAVLLAEVEAARAPPAAAPMTERHRHRFSRKPNKPRRRSTRKHKN